MFHAAKRVRPIYENARLAQFATHSDISFINNKLLLFDLPVLFYLLCIVLIVPGRIDAFLLSRFVLIWMWPRFVLAGQLSCVGRTTVSSSLSSAVSVVSSPLIKNWRIMTACCSFPLRT